MGIEIGLGTALLGSAAAGLIGSKMQAGAQQRGAELQASTAEREAQRQREMFDIINRQQAPYRGAGYSSLNQILAGLTGQQPVYDTQGNLVGTTQGSDFFTRMPTAADIEAMPGYKFAVEQGMGATGQAMNVAGGGSNVDRARQKFAIDYTLGTALPQYETQRSNIFRRLADIAGIGQTGQQQTQQAQMQTAGNIAQLGMTGAGALGAGQIGAAQAYGQGLQGLGNAAFMYNLLNRPQGASTLGAGYSNAATMLPSGDIGARTLTGI